MLLRGVRGGRRLTIRIMYRKFNGIGVGVQ
jgi:hypothetical protein